MLIGRAVNEANGKMLLRIYRVEPDFDEALVETYELDELTVSNFNLRALARDV